MGALEIQINMIYHICLTVSQILGRIFSKFSEAKLIALNEVGIHNVISLFLILATTAGLQEIVRIHVSLIQIHKF